MRRFRLPRWPAPTLLVTAACLLPTTPAGAVVGGEAPAGSYQWVVNVAAGDPASPGSRRCSGALVAPRWVLTLSSCFGPATTVGPPPAPSTVTIGRAANATTIGIDRLVPYGGRDITLARLAAPVSGIQPVRFGADTARTAQTLHIAGFGRTATEWAPLTPHTADVTVRNGLDVPAISVDPVSGGLCRGDAGGPVTRDRNGVAELVGLNSTGWQQGCLRSTETRTGAELVDAHDLAGWIRATVIETPLADGSLYRQPAGAIAVMVGGAAIGFNSVAEITATGYPTSWTEVPEGTFGVLPSVPADGTVVGDEGQGVAVMAGGARIPFVTVAEINETGHGGDPIRKLPNWYGYALPSVPADGTVLRNSAGGMFVTAGGAQIWLATVDEVNRLGYGGSPRTLVPGRYLDSLRTVPSDGTAVIDEQGSLNLVVGGARIWISSWAEFAATGYADVSVTRTPARFVNNLPVVPANGTVITSAGSIYLVVGGAKVWFGSPQEMAACGYAGKPQTEVPVRSFNQLSAAPADGTLVGNCASGVSVMAGGAAFDFPTWEEYLASGYNGQPLTQVPPRYLTGHTIPVDGTLLRTASSAQVWRVAAGTRTAYTATGGENVTVVGPTALNRIPVAS